ncbi:MAG: TonB-dependent receptor [Bacteroidia bacterium]|nr:TonB-dependent receptor [Bacteroidia bacterium]
MTFHRHALLILGFLTFLIPAFAQPLQTIRGKIVDDESQYPLGGTKVIVTLEDGSVKGALADEDGNYRVESVPVGRVSIDYVMMGYLTTSMNNIIVTSAKEVIINVSLRSSSVEMEAVELTATKQVGDARNEMATVSAREFSVVETNLYAGSRGEPARMASNYAGVQGADDSRNDIVVRGNTPSGVLWRLDGVNIPNPNHFVIPGTGGGSVTILNNKFLSNSDFFTGAFPGEYANGISGVFDLKMRNGNNEKHEFSGQLGFLGTELMAEGPLSKKTGASYLGMFRYSTLQLFSFMGINVGTDAVPQYLDGAFRLNFPLKSGANLAVWGMGGYSDIDIVLSEATKPDTATLIYGDNDRDQYFGSRTVVGGVNYTHPLNQSTFIKASIAASQQKVLSNHDQIFRHVDSLGNFVYDSLPPILDYTFAENKINTYFFINKKIGRNQVIKAGFNVDYYDMNYIDSARTVLTDSNGKANGLAPWVIRWNAHQGAILAQPYIQYKLNVKDKFTFTAGLTSLYWSLNKNSFSPVEPRIGAQYNLGGGKRLSFGAGLHSQIQSPYLYFYGQKTINRVPQPQNTGMGLSKSIHNVLGYDMLIGKNLRLRAEVYYQYLFNIPVDVKTSSFSLLNAGSGFARFFPDSLQNTGHGRNYGLELTLERFFRGGWYFLATGSVFDAKYQGSDNVWRNVSFNGRFAFNGIFAKEFKVGGKNAFQISGKATYVGGRWYGPVDDQASRQALDIIYVDSTVNTLQFRPYFRVDAKILYRWNRPKVTHEIAIDLVNFLNIKNILTLTYAPDHPSGNPIREEYQLGFLPLFYYKIDF